MHVPEINKVKEQLESLKSRNLISAWELPYENLLTRLSAAIFFIAPVSSAPSEDGLAVVWSELNGFENFSKRINTEKKLSQMLYRVTFSKEEADKNIAEKEVNAVV